MNERITSIRAPQINGIESWGRKSRSEMIANWRNYYQHQLEEAQRALAVPDEELIVETYLGAWGETKSEIVTE